MKFCTRSAYESFKDVEKSSLHSECSGKDFEQTPDSVKDEIS